jgi:hypothetical protein
MASKVDAEKQKKEIRTNYHNLYYNCSYQYDSIYMTRMFFWFGIYHSKILSIYYIDNMKNKSLENWLHNYCFLLNRKCSKSFVDLQ